MTDGAHLETIPESALRIRIPDPGPRGTIRDARRPFQETHMRRVILRALVFAALPVTLVAVHPARAHAQPATPRALPIAIEPDIIRTNIEGLLAMPDVALVTDFYPIDMRFGPNLRIDAVVVAQVDSPTRLRGLRVQVRDNDNRNRQEGTSFLDIDEIAKLS